MCKITFEHNSKLEHVVTKVKETFGPKESLFWCVGIAGFRREFCIRVTFVN